MAPAIAFEIELHDDASVSSLTYRGHVHGVNVSVPYDDVSEREDGTWTISGEVWPGNSDTFEWEPVGTGFGILGFEADAPTDDYTVRVSIDLPTEAIPPYVPEGGYGDGGYGN